ncbi:TPA: glycosyltransferase family 2 protein [Photobacterium damselae]
MIFAIVVLYNPNLDDLKKTLDILCNQVDFIVLGNNSNYIIDINYVENIKIFNFMENLGIAKAQNICMDWAFNNNAEYIIQIDQDSIPHEDLVEKLMLCYSGLEKAGVNVGIVGAVDYDKDTKTSLDNIKDNAEIYNGFNVILTDYIISSGSLISKKIYDLVGEMDDGLFIDLVDFEYCWKVSYNGFTNVKFTEAKLAHKVGEGRIVKGPFKLYTPAPVRQYYQYRNFILLSYRKYVPFKWKCIELVKCCSNIFLSPIFLGQPKLRLSYIFKGIYSGLIRRTGRYE